MPLFKKKPLIVKATQWFPGMDLPHVKECGILLPKEHRVGKFWNHLHELELEVKPGGWIVDAGDGDLYPCDESVFKKTFDPVESSNYPMDRFGDDERPEWDHQP